MLQRAEQGDVLAKEMVEAVNLACGGLPREGLGTDAFMTAVAANEEEAEGPAFDFLFGDMDNLFAPPETTDALIPVLYADLLGRDATTIEERFRIVDACCEVLSVFSAGDVRVEEVRQLRMAMTLGDQPIEEGLERAEAMIAEIDRSVSVTVLRRLIRHVQRPHLVCYARRLAEALTQDERLVRLELVLTYLLSGRDHLRVVPRVHASPLLTYVGCGRRASQSVRNNAIAVFEQGLQRVGIADTIETLIETGFFFDVLGHKLAMRRAILDPDVLYSAAKVGTAVERLLNNRGNADERHAFHIRFEEECRRVITLIDQVSNGAQAEPAPDAPVSTPPPRKRPSTAPSGEVEVRSVPPASPKKRTTVEVPALSLATGKLRLAMLVLAAVALGALSFAKFGGLQTGQILNPLDPRDLAAISTLFESGGLSSGGDVSVFIASVDESKWEALSPLDRRRSAARIRTGLAQLAVPMAHITVDGLLAIQIVNNQVVSVQ